MHKRQPQNLSQVFKRCTELGKNKSKTKLYQVNLPVKHMYPRHILCKPQQTEERNLKHGIKIARIHRYMTL